MTILLEFETPGVRSQVSGYHAESVHAPHAPSRPSPHFRGTRELEFQGNAPHMLFSMNGHSIEGHGQPAPTY